MFSPEPWMKEAACIDTPTKMFFPGRGRNRTLPAKQVCAGCPVRQECLDYAIEHRIHYGVWGGLAEDERRELTKAVS